MPSNDIIGGGLEKGSSFNATDYPSMGEMNEIPLMRDSTDFTSMCLPYLHPSDPTTYTALPNSLLQSEFDLSSDSSMGFSSFDWSNNPIQVSDASITSPVMSSTIESAPYVVPNVNKSEVPESPGVQASGTAMDSEISPGPVASLDGPSVAIAPRSEPVQRTSSRNRGQACDQGQRAPQQIPIRKIAPFEAGYMTVTIDQQLVNRLQWYQLTCQLLDANGRPLLRNQNVSISPSVAFIDSRRRADASGSDSKLGGVSVNAIATCASTGQHLEKCTKCREKDKALRKRKRKRDQEELWQEQDELANTKLVQLYCNGTEQVNHEGVLNLRLRIGCCIGVTKQHHLNHVKSLHEQSKEILEIHKSCEGTVVTVILSISPSLLENAASANASLSPNPIQLSASTHTPIRVLGKVTEAERLKLTVKEPNGANSSSEDSSTSDDEVAPAPACDSRPHAHNKDFACSHMAETVSPKLKREPLTSPAEKMVVTGVVTHPVEPLEVVNNEPVAEVEIAPKRVHKKGNTGHETHFLPTDPAQLQTYSVQVPGHVWPMNHGISDIEELSLGWRSRRQFKGCSSCAARGDRELFSTISPAKINPLIVLQHFGKVYKTAFERAMPSTNMEMLSQSDATNLFAQPSLDPQSDPTPAKLQVYSVLAVCSCITGYLDSAHKFWSWAIEIADSLLSLPLTRDPMEAAIFADGLNRLAYYFGAGGDCAKGAFYNAQAVKCLQALAASGHANLVYTLPVYETALWSYVTYRLDAKTVHEAQQWAIAQRKHEMLAYTYFLQLLAICVPDLKEYVTVASQLQDLSQEFQGLILSSQVPRVPLSALHPFRASNLASSPFLPITGFAMSPGSVYSSSSTSSRSSPSAHLMHGQNPLDGSMNISTMSPNSAAMAMEADRYDDQRTVALQIVASLRALYFEAGFINTTMRTAANAIIEHGFEAMEAWFAGDTARAAENARTTLIQASLQDFPRFPSLIHIHFSCFVCLFLAEDAAAQRQQQQQSPMMGLNPDFTESPWIDYVELGIKAFTRVSHYRWIRILIDYFVQRLDAFLGRHIDMHTCPLRDDTYDQGDQASEPREF
jgi:hypothetical protein